MVDKEQSVTCYLSMHMETLVHRGDLISVWLLDSCVAVAFEFEVESVHSDYLAGKLPREQTLDFL